MSHAFQLPAIIRLKEVYAWRNQTAREEDESESYVLPIHMLLKVCTELPKEMQGILACCNPVPPLVKQNLQQIHMKILKAREQPLTMLKADIEQTNRTNDEQINKLKTNFADDPLRCPLDLGGIEEFPRQVLMDSEGLVQNSKTAKTNGKILKSEPAVKIFNTFKIQKKSSTLPLTFMTPYARYQMLKPYLKILAEKDANPDQQQTAPVSDMDRISSIKEHFAALTAMTPAEYSGQDKPQVQEEPSKSDSDDDEDVADGPAFVSVEAMPKSTLRMGKQASNKKNKKGKKRKNQRAENL